MIKKYRRQLSVFMIVIMFVSLSMPVNMIAEQNENEENDKIESKLLETFENGEEQTDYIVVLKDQTDTEKVALQAEKEAKENSLSAEDANITVKKAVVSALENNAETEQANIVSYLEEDSENISDYQSFFIVNALKVTGTQESAEQIAKQPEVKSVLLDKKHDIQPMEKNEAQDDDTEWNIERIGVPDVWDDGVTGEGVVVANIDSGVDWEHPAVQNQYRGYNPDDPDNPDHEFSWHDSASSIGTPVDSDGHGTHTMGTMIGQEPDGNNKVGVAPGAKWIAARAFSPEGAYDHHLLDAGQWILAPTDDDGEPHPEKAPDVVNNSWGGNNVDNDWFLPMVSAWRDAGIVPVFSAGNTEPGEDAEPVSASEPGNYKESIAVGATDEEDELASFSLRGPTEEGDLKPNISAPGVNIRSSDNTSSYQEMDGTSMAAPHVAGTVALLKQEDPSLTIEQIEQVLYQTADVKTDDEYPDSPNNGFGYGLLNVKAAVGMVQSDMGLIDGQVMSTGEDNEAPDYDMYERETLFKNEDETFVIRAMDDVSVSEVELTTTSDDGTEESYAAEIVDGDHLDGEYEVTVPEEDITGESFEYGWTITDFSGKETKTDTYSADIVEGINDGYSEDFETYPDGWYSYGLLDNWEWGKPEYGPDSAASGDKVIGTNLRGLYDDSADMTMVMPPVMADENTVLRFKTWYKLAEFGDDMGTVFVSEDKETWEPVYQVRNVNTSWHEIGLDLSKYAGEKIYIAFNLQSDLGNEEEGWYIDDVTLVDDSSKTDVSNEVYDEEASLDVPDSDDKQSLSAAENETDINDEKDSAEDDGESDDIPVEATVTVEETGWETETEQKDGGFTIYHEPGDYTLDIDAYGYESKTEKVSLSEDGHVSPDIHLTPLPEQTISGKITDQHGKEIEDATVFLLDEEKYEPVTSDGNGDYNLDAYEGTYTLKIFADGYFGVTEEITVEEGEELSLDAEMEPFYDSGDSEIKYDNGEYSKNLAFSKKGNGFAQKMSLEDGESSAKLTGAKMQFWADHVPKPGGDDILVAVYDANGEDGAPGNKLVGPVEAKAERDLDQWTEIDLSDLGIVVDDDFYIVYLQADDYPYIPGFVADGDTSNYADRGWEYVGGMWIQSDDSVGNYMIRAMVDYGDGEETENPEISSPESGLVTNDEKVDVKGTADPDSEIRLERNEEEAGTVDVDTDGMFEISDVTLSEGENELKAVGVIDGDDVSESEITTVTLDTTEPELTIDSPEDGDVIEEDSVTVEGTVSGDHLDWVKVNDEETAHHDDGTFESEVKLDNGENEITAEAMDEAGNSSTQTITVIYGEDAEDPVITSPEDGRITNDEEVDVEGTAEPGSNIRIENNGEKAGSGDVSEEGKFSETITLSEGDNDLKAIAIVDDDEIGVSEEVTVTLDTEKPELKIDSPSDGEKTNRETITVEGTIKDENKVDVEINGDAVSFSDDGSFSKRVMLDSGTNTIEVVAVDQAGNETSKSITVQAYFEAPTVENLEPSDDVGLTIGETVKIEFDSEPDLTSTFKVKMPLTNQNNIINSVIEFPMMEESEGHYVGYWTVPVGAKANAAVLEVKAKDTFGNETYEEASGTLDVNPVK